jgi:uncharacterized MAPEG superfamily protein
MSDLLAIPAVRSYVVVALLLVLKIAAVGSYTTILRLRRKHYATPEDYAFWSAAPRPSVDEDIERVRRAHLNDLENVLPFLVAAFLFALTGPGPLATRIYLWGFLTARVLHSIFYIQGKQPHRTLAFTVGAVLMLFMVVQTLVRVATTGP